MAIKRARVYVKRLYEDVTIPQYETNLAAGVDLRAYLPEEKAVTVPAKGRYLFKTGLTMEIPPNCELTIRPRSGLAIKNGVCAHLGTIDADYRGEIGVILFNFGEEDFRVEHGDRIAQAVLSEIAQAGFVDVDKLSDTLRGVGGFGSTGTK